MSFKNKKKIEETLPPCCCMGQHAGSRKMSSSLSQSSRFLHSYWEKLWHDFLWKAPTIGTVCYWSDNVSIQQHVNTPLVAICWRVSQMQHNSALCTLSGASSAMKWNTVHCSDMYSVIHCGDMMYTVHCTLYSALCTGGGIAGAWFAGILWPVSVRSSAVQCTAFVIVFVFVFSFFSSVFVNCIVICICIICPVCIRRC